MPGPNTKFLTVPAFAVVENVADDLRGLQSTRDVLELFFKPVPRVID
jgi:hypothetical protein